MRVTNRILGALFALALLLASAVVFFEVLSGYLVDQPVLVPWQEWNEGLRSTQWSDGIIRIVFAGIGLAGLILLSLQLIRRGPLLLPIASASQDVDYVVHRPTVEKAIERATEDVDGVAKTSVHLKKRKIKLDLTTNRSSTNGLKARAIETTEDVLKRAGVKSRKPVVKVRKSRSSSRRKTNVRVAP